MCTDVIILAGGSGEHLWPVSDATHSFYINTFKEKPDAATARDYLDDGHYYWNSGIYAFRTDFYMSELKKYNPEISTAFEFLGTSDSLAKHFDDLPANAVALDTTNCFVCSDILVALCGVEDIVVVIRNGKALVSKKGETNLVKDALSLMKRKGFV